MWILTIRSPLNKAREYALKMGINTLGRQSGNDVVIADESASRWHAEIDCQPDRVVIHDLGSMNGTFVNREHLTEPYILKSGDQIRIGQHIASIFDQQEITLPGERMPLPGTRPLTPELLLESVDQNAVFLYEITNRLTTVLDLERALQELADFLRVATGADACRIILSDQFDQLDDLVFSTSIARQAIEQCSVVVVPDLSAHSPKPQQKTTHMPPDHSVLCAPVLSEQEIAAIVYLAKADPAARAFDQTDVKLTVAISHQAALTIQRTRILEKARLLEQWALTDSLTGLDNRRQIIRMAEIEFERALRFHHPLTLLMLDIDNYKQVNDTFGHIVGDQVLKAVAERCRKMLRSIDFLGRYGGDEFMVLLVETSRDDARCVAEHLRQCVADVPVVTDRGQLNITISIGVAAIEDSCVDMPKLLGHADDALYAAKNAGKNRVEVSM